MCHPLHAGPIPGVTRDADAVGAVLKYISAVTSRNGLLYSLRRFRGILAFFRGWRDEISPDLDNFMDKRPNSRRNEVFWHIYLDLAYVGDRRGKSPVLSPTPNYSEECESVAESFQMVEQVIARWPNPISPLLGR